MQRTSCPSAIWVDMSGETVRNVDLDIKEGEILGIGRTGRTGQAGHSERNHGALRSGRQSGI